MQVTKRRAGFSRCRTYRYWLSREFAQGSGQCVFIGLNPSTGDQSSDDATIRRCMGFASDWGYRHLTVVNLFAYRTAHPEELRSATEPEGGGNRAALRRACSQADLIVAAWGVHGTYLKQSTRLKRLWRPHTLHCLSQTTNSQPAHPLYQPKSSVLTLYSPD